MLNLKTTEGRRINILKVRIVNVTVTWTQTHTYSYGFLSVRDSFRKPKLLKPLPGFIDKISINFSIPLEKLEEDVCRLLNEDRVQKDKQADGYSIEITDRKLLVGCSIY